MQHSKQFLRILRNTTFKRKGAQHFLTCVYIYIYVLTEGIHITYAYIHNDKLVPYKACIREYILLVNLK